MSLPNLRLLLVANGLLLALLIGAGVAVRAEAQWMTGPSSIRGKCCKTAVEGDRFCCTSCCLGPSLCSSDQDPVCRQPSGAGEADES